MTFSQASMPANIALIKYMGKKDAHKNIPANPSFSYTLNHLKTTVLLKLRQKDFKQNSHSPAQDKWTLNKKTLLTPKEKSRFISHLNFLRKTFNYQGTFDIESENNFPPGCGLASSASSFAALTQCAVQAFGIENISVQRLAELSRQGSGSSCRSFFSPFALWENNQVKEINFSAYRNLIHQVIIVSHRQKDVSSSQAHEYVQTSNLYPGREKRAASRLENLLNAFEKQDWEKSYKIIWQEFWDMHVLFETCPNPFGYLKPPSIAVLNYLRKFWQKHHDGPLITLDAGPNIHVLFRPDQALMAEKLKIFFQKKFLVL